MKNKSIYQYNTDACCDVKYEAHGYCFVIVETAGMYGRRFKKKRTGSSPIRSISENPQQQQQQQQQHDLTCAGLTLNT